MLKQKQQLELNKDGAKTKIFNVKINEVTKIKPKVFIPWDINNPYLYNIKIEY